MTGFWDRIFGRERHHDMGRYVENEYFKIMYEAYCPFCKERVREFLPWKMPADDDTEFTPDCLHRYLGDPQDPGLLHACSDGMIRPMQFVGYVGMQKYKGLQEVGEMIDNGRKARVASDTG